MHPAEQAKLLFEMTLLQRHDKPHETDCVECKADDPMVCGEREEVRLCKDHMLQSRG